MHGKLFQIASNLTKLRENPNVHDKLDFRRWQFSIASFKSFHNINSLLHLKYSKTITPVWPVSTQAYLAFAGLVNVPKMILRVVNSNVFPQFAGRTVIILWNFSLPLASKSLIASAKMLRLMQFTGTLEQQCTSFSQVLVPFTKCTIWLFSLLQCS